jgi:hypothetical protein
MPEFRFANPFIHLFRRDEIYSGCAPLGQQLLVQVVAHVFLIRGFHSHNVGLFPLLNVLGETQCRGNLIAWAVDASRAYTFL